MNRQDCIDYAEAMFDCKLGFPGRYADGHSGVKPYGQAEIPRTATRQYVTLLVTRGAQMFPHMHSFDYDSAVEHGIACDLINAFDRIRRSVSAKPTLYWRHLDKIQYENAHGRMWMRARIYVEGCKDYGGYRQDKMRHDYLRVVIDSSPNTVPLLTLQQEQT